MARARPEPIPPGELFREARESLALILAGRTVEVRIAAGCPDLWADPSLTLEALVNLLENAARAAPPERPVVLAAEPDPVDRERVRIEVRDQGPGMPEPGDGVPGGLGLQIVRGFVEANGGTFFLLGRAGEERTGTVARFTLPAAPEPEEIPG